MAVCEARDRNMAVAADGAALVDEEQREALRVHIPLVDLPIKATLQQVMEGFACIICMDVHLVAATPNFNGAEIAFIIA